MKIIRDSLKVPVKNSGSSAVILLCLSLFLSACGGGGPDEEEKNSATSTTSKQYSTVTNSSFSNSSNATTLLSEGTNDEPGLLCQQQNSLLCENFEWSSSLAYKASPVDWLLKGWQFTGVDSSGIFCNTVGADSSQCALKWVQKNDKSLDIDQKASYSYSQYGAGFNKLSLSWAAKWSEQWVWDTRTQSHLALESVSANKVTRSLFSVAIDSDGFVQLIISGDELCRRDEIIVESDKSFVLQGDNLGKWQQFKMEFNLDAESDIFDVSLSVNNEVIISKANITLGCSAEYSAPDTVSFLTDSYNQQITADQNVLIDNIQISYK